MNLHNLKISAIQKRLLQGVDEGRNFSSAQYIQDLTHLLHHNGRRVLPQRRTTHRIKARIANQPLYLDQGLYENGDLGELFCTLQKEGSFVRSILNAFCVAVSLGLQYGVPLDAYIHNFVGTTFEPNGFTQGPRGNGEFSSILDFIFREIAAEHGVPVPTEISKRGF